MEAAALVDAVAAQTQLPPHEAVAVLSAVASVAPGARGGLAFAPRADTLVAERLMVGGPLSAPNLAARAVSEYARRNGGHDAPVVRIGVLLHIARTLSRVWAVPLFVPAVTQPPQLVAPADVQSAMRAVERVFQGTKTLLLAHLPQLLLPIDKIASLRGVNGVRSETTTSANTDDLLLVVSRALQLCYSYRRIAHPLALAAISLLLTGKLPSVRSARAAAAGHRGAAVFDVMRSTYRSELRCADVEAASAAAAVAARPPPPPSFFQRLFGIQRRVTPASQLRSLPPELLRYTGLPPAAVIAGTDENRLRELLTAYASIPPGCRLPDDADDAALEHSLALHCDIYFHSSEHARASALRRLTAGAELL